MTIIAFEANIKDRFFDREKVVRQIGRANVKRLSKWARTCNGELALLSCDVGPRRGINGRTKASLQVNRPMFGRVIRLKLSETFFLA